MCSQAAATACGVVDDENSQAEGTVEGAVGYSRNNINEGNNLNITHNNNNPNNNNSNSNLKNNNNNILQQQQQQNHPYYENIYESIERRPGGANVAAGTTAKIAGVSGVAAAAVAIAPADVIIPNNNNNNKNPNNDQKPPQAAGDCLQTPNSIAASPNLNNTQPRKLMTTAGATSNNLNIGFRNDLYDRTNTPAYDVPRSVRSGLGFRRNFQLDLNAGNRFDASRYSPGPLLYGSCQRQRSFDDTESPHYYNNMHCNPPIRYENIYEQIRDEPIYRNTGSGGRVYRRMNVIGHGIGRIERHLSSSCGNIDHYNLGGHYAVLGHSHFGTVGHIRLNAGGGGGGSNNSSSIHSCVGVNAAVAGVGNGSAGCTTAATGFNSKDPNNVKNSATSFFSCLHGENSQSMSNIYRATSGSVANNGGTHNSSKDREIRSASAGPSAAIVAGGGGIAGATAINSSAASIMSEVPSTSSSSTSKATGAIPKIKALNLSATKTSAQNALTEKTLTIKNALTRKTTAAASYNTASSVARAATATAAPAEHSNSTLNRISKSSLQWLLVNKWLPLWIGQGPDCKVIDFNFMFSRDCVGCDAVSATTTLQANPYGTPRLSGLPQDIVRFNGRAEMHAPCAAAAAAAVAVRRDASGRPLKSTLNRLREGELNKCRKYRHEDPSYENVHVQWHNGFEFGRSRDPEQSAAAAVYQQQHPLLQRARSESPNFVSHGGKQHQRHINTTTNNSNTTGAKKGSAKYEDPFKKYELNAENNSFKPKTAKIEAIDVGVGEASGGTTAASAATETTEEVVDGGGAVGGSGGGVEDTSAAGIENLEKCANMFDNETEMSTIKTKSPTLNQNNNENNNQK